MRPPAIETPIALDAGALARGLRVLSRRDPDLARIQKTIGAPPMWARRPGFSTLVHIILEQQVSLASARAAFNRLRGAITPLTPGRFLQLDDATLKAIGFSRQKAGYCRGLARAVVDRQLNLAALKTMDDAAVRAELLRIKGIGDWSVDIYLLMALRRPDIWPKGDLALAIAAQKLKRLASRPTPNELEGLGKAWQPWRAVAARLLWHYYLSPVPKREWRADGLGG